MPTPAPVIPAAPAAAAPLNGAATAAKPVTPPADQAPQTFQVKVDGQMTTFTLDQLLKNASKSGYADKLIKQATEAAKRIKSIEAQREQLLADKKKNPHALLKEYGVDPDEFAHSILSKKVSESQMTPEQRRIAELEAREAEMRGQLEERTKAEQKQHQTRLAQQFQKKIESELSSAATRAGIEPNSQGFYAIYEAFKEAVELDLPWDPDRIVEVAKESLDGAHGRLEKAVVGGLTGEALLTRLGPTVVEAVLQARVAQIRGGKMNGAKPANGTQAPKPVEKPSQYLSPAELQEMRLKRAKGAA